MKLHCAFKSNISELLALNLKKTALSLRFLGAPLVFWLLFFHFLLFSVWQSGPTAEICGQFSDFQVWMGPRSWIWVGFSQKAKTSGSLDQSQPRKHFESGFCKKPLWCFSLQKDSKDQLVFCFLDSLLPKDFLSHDFHFDWSSKKPKSFLKGSAHSSGFFLARRDSGKSLLLEWKPSLGWFSFEKSVFVSQPFWFLTKRKQEPSISFHFRSGSMHVALWVCPLRQTTGLDHRSKVVALQYSAFSSCFFSNWKEHKSLKWTHVRE